MFLKGVVFFVLLMTANSILWLPLALEQTRIVMFYFVTLCPGAEDSEPEASVFSGKAFQYNPVTIIHLVRSQTQLN